MGKRKREEYVDSKGNAYPVMYDQDDRRYVLIEGEIHYLDPINRQKRGLSDGIKIISAVAPILAAIIGILPLGKDGEPLACLINAPVVAQILACNSTVIVDNAFNDLSAAQTPIPGPSVILATLTPVPAIAETEFRTPVTSQISCTSPIPPEPDIRGNYIRFYSELYKTCNDWPLVWNTLANQGTVSGPTPNQRQLNCSGASEQQYDPYSCETPFGVEVFILSGAEPVIVREPHCIILNPTVDPTTIERLENYKQEHRGELLLATNVRVAGYFTLYTWCVANWE
ncbi:MAG: hypothetical protein Kow0077_22610 [Anaerolineae bacterium]